MELAFLTSAVRRYYWIVILGAVLGAGLGLFLGGGGADQYESRAVLLVSPPTQSRAVFNVSDVADRYVTGQLSVLASQGLAAEVAETLGDDTTIEEVAGAVSFEREPLTDVVHVLARSPDPERAQAIGDAYVTAYMTALEDQLPSPDDPAVVALDGQIALVQGALDEVDERITDEMEPYLARNPIPSVDQVAPGLVSEQAVLINQLSDLQAQRAERSAGLQIATEIVQDATMPLSPVPTSRRTLAVIGLVGGAFLGLLAASVAARLSPTVLDDDQGEEILGRAVVGMLPNVPSLAGDRMAVLGPLPPPAELFVEALSVRAEAGAPGSARMSVVVVGSDRAAGSTTLAAALGRRFAAPGSRVLLIDADPRDPELTQLFMTGANHHHDAWAVSDPEPETAKPTVSTTVPNLQVASLASLSGSLVGGSGALPRRPDVSALMDCAFEHADVVVFDAGSLMASATAVQLTWLCDVVVLAMPTQQRIRTLETVAAELQGRKQVLPVWTPARRRHDR